MSCEWIENYIKMVDFYRENANCQKEPEFIDLMNTVYELCQEVKELRKIIDRL